MSELFSLNKDRCSKCKACVRDCAFKALGIGEDGYPCLAEPSRCMHCQHCFAICPNGAIVFDGKCPEDSVAVEGLPLPKGNEVINWLKVRRSIRRYRKEDVDRDVLERILHSLGNVPTGCNARGLKFTCISTMASMDAFRAKFLETIENHRDGTKLLPRWLASPAIQLRNGKGDMFFRGAPGMLVISSDETTPGVTTPTEDIASAITCFELLAESHGIGTCWCGFLKLVQQQVPELLEKTLGIRRTTPFYAMLFGYPALTYARGVQREMDAQVEWL